MEEKFQMFPTLYTEGKGGEIRSWRVWVEDNDICTEHGVLGGEMQVSRKSARNRRHTAIEEAQSMYDKRLRIKYHPTVEQAQAFHMRPMLAKTYESRYAIYPGFLQPKLDGMRCLAFKSDGKISLISRGNKSFDHMTHLKAALSWLPDNTVLDGELFHPEHDFQDLSSMIRGDNPGNNVVQYHVYDLAEFEGEKDYLWHARCDILSELPLSSDIAAPVQRVRTLQVSSYEELQMHHQRFVEDGYEGSMYRHPGGLYEHGDRSKYLLKFKDWRDSEFKIVSITEGRGKFQGLAVFTCLTSSGNDTFDCVIEGDFSERATYYKNREQYIGSIMTVKYHGLFTSGKPRNPVGLRIREKE